MRRTKRTPEEIALISFMINWPQFDENSPHYDEEVNGADLVDWLSEESPYWSDAFKKVNARV